MTDKLPVKPDAGRQLGDFLRETLGIGQSMGSWTGLPPEIGAPVSGALIGAGLGGLYGMGKDWWDGEDRPKRQWWQKPSTVGAAAGTALGLLSGYAQTHPMKIAALEEKRAGMEAAYLIRAIERDPSIAYYEKNRLIGLVNQANPSQLRRLAGLAAGGALTAAAAHTILGTGFFGSAIIGGLTSMALGNLFSSNQNRV